MKMRWGAWLIALAVVAGPAAPLALAAQSKRVIITFKSGTAPDKRQQTLDALGVHTVSEILSTDTRRSFVAVVVEVPAADPSGKAAVMQLDPIPSDSAIEAVEDDYTIRWIEAMDQFNLPAASLKGLGLTPFSLSHETAMASTRDEVTWGINRVNAPMAWLNGKDGREVRVAVIDTGINSSHRDLQNGKVVQGYNAVTDCADEACWQDDNGHGTHVAGTIGAHKNGYGVVGVAPASELVAVKVLDASGSGSLSDVIKGIVWCANNKIDVANMSLGSSMPSDTMRRALRYAKARGVVIVAAAGNSGGAVGYPAAYPETIAVSASDWNNSIAAFSSRGEDIVDFIAPGVAVVSTYATGDYANLSGTSMAAPHVAGLAALAIQLGYRGLDGPDGVFKKLQDSAAPIRDQLTGELLTKAEQGFGLIDALKLVRERPSVVLAAQP